MHFSLVGYTGNRSCSPNCILGSTDSLKTVALTKNKGKNGIVDVVQAIVICLRNN